MANRHHRKRRRQPCATRWRRLLVEQFEPRTLLASAAPIGFDRTINTLEDTPYVFQASDFPLADPFESPAPNSLQAVRIASLPLNGLLLFDNQPVIVGQFISTADFNVSQIRFFPALNASGPAYANFTFQVQDNGGTVDGGIDLDPTPNTITINVTPVNDPPFGSNSNLATLEDTPYLFRATDFGFSDPFDDQANQLASVVITSLPTSGTLRIGGTSLTASNLATAGTIFAGSIGQLTFAPVSNSNDSTQPLPKFAFRLRDNGGTANGGVDTSVTANTITISVTSVNDAPFSVDRSVTTLEDTAYTFTSADFPFSDFGDTPSNSFKSIKIATLPQRGTLTNNGLPVAPGDTISFVQIVTGKLVFSPAANGNGVAYAAFTFRVQDDGGTANVGLDTSTFPNTLSFNVTPVNDPPSGSDRSLRVLRFTTRAFDLSDFGQSDTSDTPQNDLQAVIVQSLPQVGTLLLNGSPIATGMLPILISATAIVANQFTYQAQQNLAVTSFQFQPQDSGGTANGGIDVDPSLNTLSMVTGDGVNSSPDGIHNAITTAEDVSYAFRLSDFPISDMELNNLKAVKVTTLPAVGTLLDNGSPVSTGQFVSAYDIGLARLTYVPPANASGTALATFSFQVQDDGGTAGVLGIVGQDLDLTPATMTINVTPTNDPPSGVDQTVALAFCGYPYVFRLADFPFTDPLDSPGDMLRAVKIVTPPFFGGALTDNGVQVTAGEFVPAADIAAGKLVFTPTFTTSSTSDFQIQLQDTGGTANGGVDLATKSHSMSIAFTARPFAAPEGRDQTVTTLEDTPYVFRTADFPIVSGNAGDQLVAVRVATLPTAGVLRNNSVPVVVGQYISVADVAAGLLSFSAPANAAGAALATFTFQVQDNSGICGEADLDPTPNTLTINVLPINDPPQGSNRSLTLLEGSSYSLFLSDFGFDDSQDSPSNSMLAVKIATLPSLGALRLNGQPVTAGQVISAAAIAVGILNYVPPLDVTGPIQTSFNFQVQDDGGTANGGLDTDLSPNTLSLSVRIFCGRPVFDIDATVFASEDIPYIFSNSNFSLFGDEFDIAHDTVRIATLPAVGVLRINGVAIVAGQIVSATDIDRGQLTFTPPPNANGTALASFAITTDDGGECGTLGSGTITINVAAVNDAPSGSDGTVTTAEDTAYTFREADFGFQDINDQPSNTLQAVKIATLPTKGALTINGQSVALGQLIAAADIQASKLKFTPAANANGFGYANFTFQVQDNGGTSNAGTDLDPTPNALTIDVLSVNDAPSGASRNLSFSSCSDFQHTFSPSDFGFSDPNDNPANNLKSVRLVNTGGFGALTLNGFPYTNNLEVSFTSLTSGSLVYTASGTTPTTITFVVKDDGGTAVGGGFPVAGTDTDTTVRVFNIAATLAPNTAPAGIGSTVTTNEDTPYVFKTSDFPFIDAENNRLKSIVIGSPLPQMGVLRLFNGVNFVDVMPNQRIDAYDLNLGRLRFDPLPVNSNGSFFASILFKIQDDGGNCNGTSDTDTVFRLLTISVPSVNDPPEGSNKSIFISNGQPYTLSLPDFPISDPNDSPFNHLAAVRIMSLPMGGTLTNARTAVATGQFVTLDDIVLGNLIYTPPAAGQPAGILTFIVQDDGGTANGGVDRDPTPNSIYFLTTPNHPPEGTDRTITINEDDVAPFRLADFPFTDPGDEFPNSLQSITIASLPTNGQLLHFGQPVSVGQFVSASDLSLSSTALVYKPAADESGSPYASFSFQLRDDGGTESGGINLDPTPNTITINVLPVNDPPSFNHLSGNYSATDENPQTHGPATQQCMPGWATDIIPGPPDESSQTVSFIVTSTNPNLFTAQPYLNADGSLCYTPKPNIAGTAAIGVTLQDSLQAVSPTVSFNIQITKPHPLHNAVNRYDVSGTPLPNPGVVIAADDVLIVINYINARGSGPIPANAPGAPPYPDVNADDSVAADDALEVINWINSHSELAESEAPGIAVPLASNSSATNPTDIVSQSAIYADLLNMLAADAAPTQTKRRRVAN